MDIENWYYSEPADRRFLLKSYCSEIVGGAESEYRRLVRIELASLLWIAGEYI